MSAAGTIGEETEAALHLLGILCAHEGRYEEAGDAFLRAINAEPEMVGSYVELGLVYACRGEYGKMIEALRRAVEVGPGGVRAYLDEAQVPGEPEHASAGAGAMVRACARPWLQPCRCWLGAVTAKRRRYSNRLSRISRRPRRPRRRCSL